MSYSLIIAPFDFANHNKIAAQQFFDNYAFFELTPKRAKEYFLWYKNEIPNPDCYALGIYEGGTSGKPAL